jgi:hypothetical protein
MTHCQLQQSCYDRIIITYLGKPWLKSSVAFYCTNLPVIHRTTLLGVLLPFSRENRDYYSHYINHRQSWVSAALFASTTEVASLFHQYDGYPEGYGQEILRFLLEPGNIELLKEGLRYITTLTDVGIEEIYDTVRQEVESGPYAENMSVHHIATVVDQEVASRWPSLSYDAGAKILEIVTQGTAEKRVFIVQKLGITDDYEWAYVVDLDQNTFEVFGGFESKEKAPTTRFNNVGGSEDPVPALIKTFSFSQLPTTEGEFMDAVRKGIKERKSFQKWSKEDDW